MCYLVSAVLTLISALRLARTTLRQILSWDAQISGSGYEFKCLTYCFKSRITLLNIYSDGYCI